MEYFVISAKFVPLKYYTLSSQLRRLTSFSVGLFGSANSVTRSYPVMRKSCIHTCVYCVLTLNARTGRGVCGGVCVCLAYTSEDFHMKTHRYTEDSTPSEDPKTGPRKTLAKNAKNVMFYHLRGVRAPRTSTDFQPYLIYEDIRVLGNISKASGCVCVCVFFLKYVISFNIGKHIKQFTSIGSYI